MKVLVCGGRNYSNKDRIIEVLDALNRAESITSIVHGGCKTWDKITRTHVGADYLAGEWAVDMLLPVHEHLAKWKIYGRRAGPIRNRIMLRLHPDIEYVVAFPGGRGTNDMVQAALENDIPVIEVNDDHLTVEPMFRDLIRGVDWGTKTEENETRKS